MQEQEVAEAIRAGEYERAEAGLAEHLAGRVDELAEACRATQATGIRVTGWDEVDTDLWSTPGATAIGIDLSNHGDAKADAPWYEKEPCLEVSLYADTAFPFSTSSLPEIQEAARRDPVPWMGRMEDVNWALEVTGLQRLNAALLRADARDEGARWVGWWMHLQFHRAVARELSLRSLVRATPVLVSEHGVGPGFTTVYAATGDPGRQAEAERRWEARRAHGRAAAEAALGEQLEFLRTLRKDIRDWPWFRNRDKRRLLIEFAEGHQALHFPGATPGQPFWKLNDAEFEQFLAKCRVTRTAK